MKFHKIIGLTFLSIFLGFQSFISAQTDFDKILEKYEQNGQYPREVAFLHLNKNVFLEGEQLAFKAYLWDRTNNRPANASRNLYVRLKSKEGATISEQLVLLENGVSFGLIDIDSTAVKHGSVVIQAFTEYMRNFNETNHFEEEVTILNSAGENIKNELASGPILELHPESGALAFNKQNVIKVKLKRILEEGANADKVFIEDETKSVLKVVKLNTSGEGQFLLSPQPNKKYYARYGAEHRLNISELTRNSTTTLAVKDLGMNVAISCHANQQKSENMILAIHNGKNVKALNIQFDEKGESVQIIPKTDLFEGMNIFSLCKENGTSVAERHFYQLPKSIKKNAKLDYDVNIIGDSIKLTLKNVGVHGQFNNLSASILPKESKSNKLNHSLLSYTELVPYTNGQLTMPKRFFVEPTTKSMYELNNALINVFNTKNWDNAIKDLEELRHLPENGITMHGTVNKGGENFIVSGTVYGDARSGIVEKGTNTFKIDGIFPVSNEKLILSEVNEKGKSEKPGVFLRFEPMVIPKPNFPKIEIPKSIQLKETKEEDSSFTEYALFQKVTMLDEVEVTAKREEKRRDSIRDRSRGRVDFFDIDDTRRNMLLSLYLNQFGFTMTESSDGSVNIFNRSPNSPTGSIPAVYLDNFFLADFDVLFQFRMDIVDYVEINRFSISGLRRGGGGTIKIYTDPVKFTKFKNKKFDFGYPVPLGFEMPRKYRLPDYLSFDGNLFRNYGIIGWEPWLRINKENAVTLTVYNPGLSALKISLEGIINNNQIISKEFDIEISENRRNRYQSNE